MQTRHDILTITSLGRIGPFPNAEIREAFRESREWIAPMPVMIMRGCWVQFSRYDGHTSLYPRVRRRFAAKEILQKHVSFQ